MSTTSLWNEYTDAKYSNDMNNKINVLKKCAQQDEDKLLARSAKRDLGLIYFQGDDSVKDMDKARQYLQEAAEEGDENGKQFYGILLYNEGNFASFYYFREAMELGNIHSAYMMYDNLHIKEDNPIAAKMIKTVEEQMKILVDNCQWKIENGDDEDGLPQFALALVGLYDLGEKLGIDRKKGEEYLNLALEKGNGYAQFMQQNPVLMKPETMQQYKPPTAEEMKKMEKMLAKERVSQYETETKGSGKNKRVLIILVVIAAVVILFGKVLWNAAVAVVGALIPIVSVIFLLVVAYIAYGDDKGSSKSSSSGWDPIKEYNDNKNFSNMPSCIYDSSNNQWTKLYAYENCAIYKNDDFGEVTIYHCDISSKYASGSGGSFHWY